MEADRPNLRPRPAGFRQQAFDRRGVAQGQLALDLGHRTPAAEYAAQGRTEAGVIGLGDEAVRHRPRPAVGFDQRGVDAVEGGAAHQSDQKGHACIRVVH